jgi:DNA replication protein DnaC
VGAGSKPLFCQKPSPANSVRESRIASSQYESESITSNPPFDEWTSVFGAERLTGALLDRLSHHVHILEMNGDSYRLTRSKRRSRRPRSEAAHDASPPD